MWPNPQETADLVTFTKEVLNGELHFLCSIWIFKEYSLTKTNIKTTVTSFHGTFTSILDLFHHFLRLCCGSCTKLIEAHHFQTPAQFAEALTNDQLNADFIYPVLGTKSTYTLYGHFFLRFIDVSDAVLITHKPSSQKITSDLIFSSLKFWPLIMISGFLALIAGFFEWLLVS